MTNYLYKFAGEAGDDTYHQGFAIFTDAKHDEIQAHMDLRFRAPAGDFMEYEFGQGSRFCEEYGEFFTRYEVDKISDEDAATLVRIFAIEIDSDFRTYGSFPDPLEIE
jgi:hypothetical protein